MPFCACRDFSATHRLRGPRGVWYAIGIKPPCPDCHAGQRVAVYRFVGDEYLKWNINQLPVLDFRNVASLDESLLPAPAPDLLCQLVTGQSPAN